MLGLLSIAAALRQQGGPPAVFHTEIPESPLGVIAGCPTRTSIDLSLQSARDGAFTLKLSDGRTVTGSLRANQPSVLTLSGLSPGTRYRYRISASQADEVEGQFATASLPGRTFVFDVQADSHLDGNCDLDVYRNTLLNEAADHPDFLVDLGDTFMVDKYPQYGEAAAQYRAQRYWLSIPGEQSSIYLCLGNHDGEMGWVQRNQSGMTPWARSQRRRYFPMPSKGSFYSGCPEEGVYYAWSWGDALMVVLDPFVATTRKPRSEGEGWNWTLGKTQFDWLESTLRNSQAKFKFVFIHHLWAASARRRGAAWKPPHASNGAIARVSRFGGRGGRSRSTPS